ncbi:MAG TPA: hypothetical protein VK528_09075 [Flavobacterium sp.]|nr:hypothetical protein [Flavobacterium sp.]
MKFKLLKIQLPFFLLAFAGIFGTYAQGNSLYDAFDEAVGKNNLGINNGTIHLNNLRSFDVTHRYYATDKYTLGGVNYDGQFYAGISLKYDILKDIVIAKIDNKNSNLGINLITAKTEFFEMNGKKFVNLNFNSINVPKFINGFYEEDRINNQIALYTKHHKDAIEVLTNNGVFYKFPLTNEFVVDYKSQYFRCNTRSDVAEVFPDLKKEIDSFYNQNTALEKENERLFLKNLLKSLSNSLPNETN